MSEDRGGGGGGGGGGGELCGGGGGIEGKGERRRRKQQTSDQPTSPRGAPASADGSDRGSAHPALHYEAHRSGSQTRGNRARRRHAKTHPRQTAAEGADRDRGGETKRGGEAGNNGGGSFNGQRTGRPLAHGEVLHRASFPAFFLLLAPGVRGIMERERDIDAAAGPLANAAGGPAAVRGMKRGDPEPDAQTAAALTDLAGAECKRPRIDGTGSVVGDIGQNNEPLNPGFHGYPPHSQVDANKHNHYQPKMSVDNQELDPAGSMNSESDSQLPSDSDFSWMDWLVHPFNHFGHPDGEAEQRLDLNTPSASPCRRGPVADFDCSASLDCCSYPVKAVPAVVIHSCFLSHTLIPTTSGESQSLASCLCPQKVPPTWLKEDFLTCRTQRSTFCV
ncbi:hypothetical protein L3Q82_014453 [Scortum barcoo]|uniref:Uncharacterized protein n=1 Tax=Scortum barcoo TaxID=214431 RepID=A0ACB8VWP2_9TELE|nr:hypothetical protein L3Q82_014453 [Scortum barcoo]